MILVPLLVGIAVLVVALSARAEALEVDEAPDLILSVCAEPERDSSLRSAFPQLQLWIPQEDRIYLATCDTAGGAAGPDIIVRQSHSPARAEHVEAA